MKTGLPCTLRRVNSRGEERAFLFRRCEVTELTMILALQERVIAALPDRDLFVRTTEEEIAESLERDFCLGAFFGEEPALFTVMVSNRVSPRNLGTYLGYDEARLLRTVTFDTTFVAPEFRGFGLQSASIAIKEQAALDMGAAEALATVSPDNEASLNNVRAGGFEVVEKRAMYGGVERYIVRKEWSTVEKGGSDGLRNPSCRRFE